MTSVITIVAAVLFVVVLLMLFRVQQLTSVLGGELRSKIPVGNRLNGLLFAAFFFIGTIAFFYSAYVYWDDMNLPIASAHGEGTDLLFWATMAIVILVFVLVNGALFVIAYMYQDTGERKAYFFPHDDRLEKVWTIIPAVVLTLLIFFGWRSWTEITGPAPDDATVVEIMGKQFEWMVRYPGKDEKLGETNYRLIDAINGFGMKCDDKNGYDDFIPREIHLVVDKPVLLKIRARDVLHSVFLPHFRLKMDAVPGMPTRFWFTPTKTTVEMQQETGNPDFKYELACTEICGKGHFAMKKIVVVETQEEYDVWLAEQKSFFVSNPDKACMKEYLPEMPSAETTPIETTEDSTMQEEVMDSAMVEGEGIIEEATEIVEEVVEETTSEEGEN